MYPESTLIHGALLVITTIIICIYNKYRISLKEVGKFVSIPIVITMFAWMAHSNTVRFALFQTKDAGSAKRQSWASYFDAYWLGYHNFIESSPSNDAVKKIISLVPSWCGMFIITPDYEKCSSFTVTVWLFVIAIVSLGLIGLFVYAMLRLWKMLSQKKESIKGLLWLFSLLGAVIFLVMTFQGKYWSAGKLLLYISPFLFLILANPAMELLFTGETQIKKNVSGFCYGILLAASVLFISCQIIFAGMRIYNIAGNENGTGYLGNYPSDQMPGLKNNYPYQFDAAKYTEENVVLINIENCWYQDYVKLALTYEGIPYYAVPDYNFSASSIKEVQPEIHDGDTVITVEETY